MCVAWVFCFPQRLALGPGLVTGLVRAPSMDVMAGPTSFPLEAPRAGEFRESDTNTNTNTTTNTNTNTNTNTTECTWLRGCNASIQKIIARRGLDDEVICTQAAHLLFCHANKRHTQYCSLLMGSIWIDVEG